MSVTHRPPIEVTRTATRLGWPDRLLVGFFTVAGVAVLVLWATYLAEGTASTELFAPAAENATVLGRTIGAALAGLVLLAAAGGAATGAANRRNWARGAALFGAGMVGYSALNTLGETLAAGSAETGLMIVALTGAAAMGWWAGRPGRVLTGAVSYFLVGLAGFTGWMVHRAVVLAASSLTAATTVVSWPAPHYLAESLMAMSTILGLFGWVRGKGWGAGLAIAGFGTYCYSTLNALDWAAVNDTALVPVLAVTLMAAMAGAVYLVTKGET